MEAAAPRWAAYVAGALAVLVPALGAAVGLYFTLREKKATADQSEQDAYEARIKRIRTEALDEARVGMTELTKRVTDQESELRLIREALSKCKADRKALRLIAGWAKTLGMPISQELEDILKESEDSDG